jgi:hypothetical protein
MFKALMDVGFRAVWATLSLSNRLFLLFFCGVSLNTLWVSFRVVLALRDFKKVRVGSIAGVTTPSLNNLRKRLANLRQLHLFTLYLLWLCIVVNIPRAFTVFGDYKTFPVGVVLENLAFLLYCYAPVFLAFVFLHSLQWLVSARLEAFEC